MLTIVIIAVCLMYARAADDNDPSSMNYIFMSPVEKNQILSVCNRNRQTAGMSAVSWSPQLEAQAMDLANTCPFPGSQVGHGGGTNNVQDGIPSGAQNYPPGFEACQSVGCAKASCRDKFGPQFGAGIVLVCIYDNVNDARIPTGLMPQGQGIHPAAVANRDPHGFIPSLDSNSCDPATAGTAGDYSARSTSNNDSQQTGGLPASATPGPSYISKTGGQFAANSRGSSAASQPAGAESSGTSYISPQTRTGPTGSGHLMSPSPAIGASSDGYAASSQGKASNTGMYQHPVGQSGPAPNGGTYQRPVGQSGPAPNGQQLDPSGGRQPGTGFGPSINGMGGGSPSWHRNELLLDGIPVITN